MSLNLECFNHYPSPIAFEQNKFIPQLKKANKYLSENCLILKGAPLFSLEMIEFNLVSDDTIADIHEKFMDDPTPTDVITFQHGEVFVSYDTAQKEAKARNICIKEELFRYHIHGLLHLAGYEDLKIEDFEKMTALQEIIVKSLHKA